MAEGVLAAAEVLPNGSEELPPDVRAQIPDGSLIVEHQPIPFPNYPYEWPAEMLRSAAALTLQLARKAVGAGFVLKDATPYNVMFDGPSPVFLDLTSFRRRDPLGSLWPPYAQFVRTFVYPLLGSRFFGLRPDEMLLANRDGLEPGRMLALCPVYRRLVPPFLGAVTIPALFERDGRNVPPNGYRMRLARDAEEAAFVLDRLFDRAQRMLDGHRARPRRGGAFGYMNGGHGYAPAQFGEKERFLVKTFERWPPRKVLDIGCNAGHFSLMAARHGARVVAIDRDPDVAGALWRSAREAKANVLALVVDIARPPGACGWANRECESFLGRARGQFDYVLLLALLHHLLVSERAPLAEIFALAAELTTQFAVVEYIDPADAQFQQIARGRGELHRELTRESFESAAGRFFQVVEAHDVSPSRRIYLLRKGGI
jgi:SAM-dependent methyltransferase